MENLEALLCDIGNLYEQKNTLNICIQKISPLFM